ncbi:MAG: glycoside hydrolase family 36 protein [Beutenbergiaceae bacterium]
MHELEWGAPEAVLHFTIDPDRPVSVFLSPPAGHGPGRPQAMVEVLAVGHGHGLSGIRTVRSAIGDRMRYLEHEADGDSLRIAQADPVTGLHAVTTFTQTAGGCRAATTVTNTGTDPLALQQVSTICLAGISDWLGPLSSTRHWSAHSEWCAENRWFSQPLTGPQGLADINVELHDQRSRGVISRTSTSTWSSGTFLPMGALENRETGRALVWQLENNGPWRWEINSHGIAEDCYSVVLSGPTDLHHSWLQTLSPGDSFRTIPASFSTSATSFDDAVGKLTWHRRHSHRPHSADAGRPLIYNDYMNALMGDPTTEKLLPLIDGAADVGAQYFCIDAGWYDDGGDWWPSVGAWEPSRVRFGELGLNGVLQYIRDAGMRPGLWVEPEVIGVRSTVATALPDEAFMRRCGHRIREHDRYFLDLRSQAARDYLDSVFDRLIHDGAEYFKWDNNVTAGTGPDTGADSPGAALLDHTRAYLAWFDRLRDRHPGVVFEACSSGAQRQDPETLRHYDLQSTSDQQDYRRYATIAAAAPSIIPPEYAGNWAYPNPGMTPEQTAFTLVTGLSGRLYLSGHINELSARQGELVREAAASYPEVIAHQARSVPTWPLGLPGWDDQVVALATCGPEATLLFLWNRSDASGTIRLPLPRLRGQSITASPVFPASLTPWPTSWHPDRGELTIDLSGVGESARVIRLQPDRGR